MVGWQIQRLYAPHCYRAVDFPVNNTFSGGFEPFLPIRYPFLTLLWLACSPTLLTGCTSTSSGEPKQAYNEPKNGSLKHLLSRDPVLRLTGEGDRYSFEKDWSFISGLVNIFVRIKLQSLRHSRKVGHWPLTFSTEYTKYKMKSAHPMGA